MTKDLEALKKELTQLAPTVNEFKSDSVQLRVFEILLANTTILDSFAETPHSQTLSENSTAPARPRKPVVHRQPAKKKVSGGSGAKATLSAVYEAGFFNVPRTIKDIIDHCQTKMAKRIKANEISGKLGSMVRSGGLSRSKNSAGQYEYKNT